jgi:hypothetical protein
MLRKRDFYKFKKKAFPQSIQPQRFRNLLLKVLNIRLAEIISLYIILRVAHQIERKFSSKLNTTQGRIYLNVLMQIKLQIILICENIDECPRYGHCSCLF